MLRRKTVLHAGIVMAMIVAGAFDAVAFEPTPAQGTQSLYFTVDSWKGMAFHLNIQGTEVLYRCGAWGYETVTRWVAFSVPATQVEALFRDIRSLGVFEWDTRFINPGIADGEGWMLQLDFEGRQVEILGSNAQPKDFPRLVDLVARFLGRYPFGFSGAVVDSNIFRDCRTASIPLRNSLGDDRVTDSIAATPAPPKERRRK